MTRAVVALASSTRIISGRLTQVLMLLLRWRRANFFLFGRWALALPRGATSRPPLLPPLLPLLLLLWEGLVLPGVMPDASHTEGNRREAQGSPL